MAYAIAKLIHFFGLTIWFGILPLEWYSRVRMLRARLPSERHALLRLVNRLRFWQEYPGIVVVVGSGLWLSSIHGFDTLFHQTWYVTKLAFIGGLVCAESYVTYASVKTELRYKALAAAGDAPITREDAVIDAQSVVEALALFGANCVFALAVCKSLPPVALVLAAIGAFPLPIVDFVVMLRRRALRKVAAANLEASR